MARNGILSISPKLAEYDVNDGRLKKLSNLGMPYATYRLLCKDVQTLGLAAKKNSCMDFN